MVSPVLFNIFPRPFRRCRGSLSRSRRPRFPPGSCLIAEGPPGLAESWWKSRLPRGTQGDEQRPPRSLGYSLRLRRSPRLGLPRKGQAAGHRNFASRVQVAVGDSSDPAESSRPRPLATIGLIKSSLMIYRSNRGRCHCLSEPDIEPPHPLSQPLPLRPRCCSWCRVRITNYSIITSYITGFR